jgi:hypothetical protein
MHGIGRIKHSIPRAGLICVGLVLAVLVRWGSVHGGDFHASSSLACSDCHVMHYSEQHSLQGVLPPEVPLGPGGPFPRLLRQAASQLCLSCHDGRTNTPDVLGAHHSAHVRAAGALNRVGDTGPYAEGHGHTLGSTGAAPGGTWTGNQAGDGLQCKHCHEIHGNPYYRNLTPNPGTATEKFVTYLTGPTYSGTAAVQQLASTPLTAHYAVDNIRYRQTKVGITDFGLTEWCAGCHPDYQWSPPSPPKSHHSTGVTMAQGVTDGAVDPAFWFSPLQSRAPVVSASGAVPGTAGTSDNQMFCGSCHKAHGSANARSLIFDNSGTAALEDGTTMNDTCQQCHNM